MTRRDPINTRAGKRQFINSLCRSVARAAVRAVPQMPKEWDGHELRELLAELFQYERTRLLREDRRRMRNYRAARYNIGRV